MWINKKWPKFHDSNGRILSAHSINGWVGQYERMVRFYLRCQNCNPEDYLDFSFSFFQNCFHLRDWIRHSNSIVNFDNVWKDFTNTYPQIKFCRDVCNGTKHFQLNVPSIDKEFYIFREYNPNGEPDTWYVNFEEKTCKLDDLMSDCLQAWDAFIKTNMKLQT